MKTAAANAREFGPADNQGFYRQWLKTDMLFDRVFLSCVNIAPFTGEYTDALVSTMGYLAWYGRHLVVNSGKTVNRSNVLVAMWDDLMGPYLSQTKVTDKVEAVQMLITAVRALLHEDVIQYIGEATRQTYTAAANTNTAEDWNGFIANTPAHTSGEIAMRILRHLADRAGAAFCIGGVNIIIHVYLSILKRGTMSETFVDKIVDGMSTDLQIANLRIDTTACRTFFAIYGELVTDTTIPLITQHWIGLLPVPALRLRLTN